MTIPSLATHLRSGQQKGLHFVLNNFYRHRLDFPVHYFHCYQMCQVDSEIGYLHAKTVVSNSYMQSTM